MSWPKLPTRDEAISQLMSVMQAPVAKFVRTLNEVPGKFVARLLQSRPETECCLIFQVA